ncbi:MAG: NUDIX hydrolase [Burkholderiales bacterium]|nr:NUDIX hydrolase [Burkholderiales bacterium]
MSETRWKPNTTVAALIEHEGRYLLVEEQTASGVRLNQPAGHVEQGESLLEACCREMREETGYAPEVDALVGIYQMPSADAPGLTYLRFAFAVSLQGANVIPPGARVVNADQAGLYPDAVVCPLDAGILQAVWLTYDEILASRARHRSPLVLQCLDDYRAGKRYPLELIHHHG